MRENTKPMRSDSVTKGAERAPMRSLFYAMGYTKEELDAMDEEERSRVLGRSNYSANASAGVAYSVASLASLGSGTFYGGRLCFKNRELAEYAGQQFLAIYADFHIGF